jgi:hypothetical protein
MPIRVDSPPFVVKNLLAKNVRVFSCRSVRKKMFGHERHEKHEILNRRQQREQSSKEMHLLVFSASSASSVF